MLDAVDDKRGSLMDDISSSSRSAMQYERIEGVGEGRHAITGVSHRKSRRDSESDWGEVENDAVETFDQVESLREWDV
jgi:hypothetical protein